MRHVIAPIVVAFIVASLGTWALATPTHATVGGPVILGGDDLTQHGGVDSGGDLFTGWLYIQRALENIGPSVTRSGNDGSIAALGSTPSDATSNDAGAAIGLAGAKVSRSVAYFEGPTAIDGFFADLASGSAKPAIIWIAGDDARNDLSDGIPGEEAAITTHATAIAGFVSSGGGLMSHGTYYDWLTALLPGATTVNGGCDVCEENLYFTPDGLTDLPALTTGDINAGPWHNHFEGDLGGLKVLVRSSEIHDSTGQDAAVIIGGSKVTFAPEPTADAATPVSCDRSPLNPRCGRGGGGGGGSNVTPAAGSPVPIATAVATVRPAPTAPPAPTAVPSSSAVLGVIRAPNTGTGPDGNSSPMSALLVSSVLLLAGAGALRAALRFKRS
jgi:hypothetical protein